MRTTLSSIRAHSPCCDGWEKLLRHLDKTQPDDEPLLIETILDANGIDDALWCLRAVEVRDRDLRLYAVWCARRIEHLMSDPRSVAVLDVAERYARGRATDDELKDARAAAAWAAVGAVGARAAARAAVGAIGARAAARAPVWAAVGAAWAAWAAATAAATAAGKKEKAAQAKELRRICREIEAGRDPYPGGDGR
jgi:hypothetical protein